MRASTVMFALFAFATIVGMAPAAQAKASCGCRQQSPIAGDEGGGAVPSPNPKASPRASGRPDGSQKAKEQPARRILEIELNFFGRRYNIELITTSPSAALTPAHSSPALPAEVAPAPAALG
ncbi:MAG: hypothetical protein ACRCV9_17420 [Burkholderiaceae bacterium]